jgi:uncharacterized Ntn-hydrolase superfamily protein
MERYIAKIFLWAPIVGLLFAFMWCGFISYEDSTDAEEMVFSTFSICAIDPATDECGVAVTTRVPFVGRAVPYVEAGIGAVATQAQTILEYGPRGLALIKEGLNPKEAIMQMLSDDKASEHRQIGIINMKGESYAHTGDKCGLWAGSRQGKNYTVQANIMVGQQVVDAVADFFEKTEGRGMPLAERLILALEAGQQQGGDNRWGLFQSAAIKVADPHYPPLNGRRISLAIEVGEHPQPVQEMKRIYYKTGRHLGYREFSEIKGPDVIELKRMLHALGYWRKDLHAFPEPPERTVPPEWRRTDPEKYQTAMDEYRKKMQSFNEQYSFYDDETMDAVDAFRKDHTMNYTGNPRGLVDQKFIDILREEYYFRKKQ